MEVEKLLGPRTRYLAGSLVALGLLLPLQGTLVSALQPSPPAAPSEPTAPLAAPVPVPIVILDAVTFAADRGVLYLPARELAKALGWRLRWDARAAAIYLNDKKVPAKQRRRLLDGTQLVSLAALADRGLAIAVDDTTRMTHLTGDRGLVGVRVAPKRVVVNRTAQRLRAWEGGRLVLDTRVSTGARGYETPRGSFTAGPLKAPMLISRKYNNAPMPWSVQVWGNVCIHGHTSIPPRPASHGCIRMPLTGQNAARWFYDWVPLGTPITIADVWPKPAPPQAHREEMGPPSPAPAGSTGRTPDE